ncbi:MAG: hypothetical protein ACHQX3_06990, partial [Nitrospirales bacterium]
VHCPKIQCPCSSMKHTEYGHTRKNPGKRDCVMIRTAIISMLASFVLVGVWTVNLVSYHPAADLNPIAPLSTNFD